MSKNSVSALALAQDVMARHVRPGDLCVDATAGRGGDTAYLCSLVGESGRVLAFDIQEGAVESTRLLLEERGFAATGRVIHDSHVNMSRYVEADSVSCIAFNLGWLPGGDHAVHTEPETTIAAIEQGLGLLKPGGIISVCVYYGRDCGFGERDALLEYLSGLDYRRYTVLRAHFLNRPNNPPFPVFITRDE